MYALVLMLWKTLRMTLQRTEAIEERKITVPQAS